MEFPEQPDNGPPAKQKKDTRSSKSIFSIIGMVLGYAAKFVLCLIGLWFVVTTVFGNTQGSLYSAWLRAGCPLLDSQEHLERRAPGQYLPNRCDKFMNDRASTMLELMDEDIVCDQPHANFVCRLLVFDRGMHGPVKCFRIDKNANGAGDLYYKEVCYEPFVYHGRQHNGFAGRQHNGFTGLTKQYPLSTAKLKDLFALLEAAEEYYMKNRYHSFDCTPRTEHYLLEFQLAGKYFYYDAEGREPDEVHAQPTAPIAPYLQNLLQFCESIAVSK